jgi:hypothetical protein
MEHIFQKEIQNIALRMVKLFLGNIFQEEIQNIKL